MNDWWDNGNNQIAFARENKGFIAINRAGYDMSENLQTGLPQGTYCNVINGDYTNGGCGGKLNFQKTNSIERNGSIHVLYNTYSNYEL